MHSTVNGRMAGRNESGLLSEGVIHLEKKVSSKFIFFFGSFAGILFGYDIGIIAGAEGHIQEEFQLSPLWLGIVVSSLMGGAIIGSILSGLMGDKFGRRKLILVSSIIFLSVRLAQPLHQKKSH